MSRFALTLVLLAGACAPRPAAPPSSALSTRPALDSATARRLCANADSVAAGRAGCELRDQRRPPRVF